MRFVDCTGSFRYLELSTDDRIQINIFRSGDFFKKVPTLFYTYMETEHSFHGYI